MLKTLRTFLTIPPVDQRPAVGQWWGLKIFPAYRPKTEWDDVYIYAQLAITTTLTGVILGAIAIAMYTKGYALEWVLETNRTGMWSATNYKSTAVAYLHVYCIIYRQIIAFILIPFFLLKSSSI